MNATQALKDNIAQDGFAILDSIYTEQEVNKILSVISAADSSRPTFRKSQDLFAIRQFFKEVPACAKLIFNQTLLNLINETFGSNYFVVKSIYFDKPEDSNWFVCYHQDLTISVDKKLTLEGYGPWTTKQNQFAVQPPLAILEDNFTVRIHLDHTDEENGALRVIPQSHRKGIYRPEAVDRNMESEISCPVARGGVMIMKPLLLHSSNKTTNKSRRRVIHIEFSQSTLAESLNWAEFLPLNESAV